MRLRLGLSTKINLIIVTAMMIPLLVLAFLSVRTIREIGISNLEAFVSENGSRRQAAIGDDLRDSLRILNEFIVANDDALSLTLTQQATSIQDEAQIASLNQDLQGLIRRDLIDTGYYNSVRVLSEVYFPLASITMSQSPLSAETLQEQREAVSQIANRLNIDNGDVQVFGISNRDDITRVEVLTALLDEATDGTSNIAGYLLVDLNLTEIFIDNLTLEEIFFDTSAYVIVESGSERIVIAPDDVLDNRLFDVNSFGAERALSNLGSTVNIYDVEAEDGITREVVGYSSNLTIDNNTFVVITEVDTSQLLQLIRERTVGQIFVFIVVLTVLILLACLLVANQLILPPVQSLRDAILAVIRGDFSAPVMGINRSDEIGSLATSFVDMRVYIRELTDDMTRRLDERTRDVQVTQDIAQAMTTERELTALMARVVTLIADNFPSIYHAQIFLIDNAREYAVLRASTGAAGRELLGRGHKLRVGSISLVGQVAEQGKVVIARDTAESTVHRENQFLGDTRAEVGIPLQLSTQIIGVLDVQSKQRDSFTSEQITALQTLADQITIAIENTRLYAETDRLLRETQREQADKSKLAWQQYLVQLRQSDMTVSSGANTGYNFQKLTAAVLMSGEPIVGSVTSRETIPFVVPVKLRDQVLGVVEYEVPQVEFDYGKVLLAQELVARLAISLENARLFQATQQATERERIVNDISAKLTSQTDIESILQTAVREIEQALRTPQVAIRFGTNTLNGHSEQANGAHHPNGKHTDNSSQ